MPRRKAGPDDKRHESREVDTLPPTDRGPPSKCTIGEAINLAFGMAVEITGSFHPDECDLWREWLGQALKLIKDELPGRILNTMIVDDNA